MIANPKHSSSLLWFFIIYCLISDCAESTITTPKPYLDKSNASFQKKIVSINKRWDVPEEFNNWIDIAMTKENSAFRFKFHFALPANIMMKSCGELVFKSESTIGSIFIDFGNPWIKYFDYLKKKSCTSGNSTFSMHAESEKWLSGTVSVRMEDQQPIMRDIKIISKTEIRQLPRQKKVYQTLVNNIILSALEANESKAVIVSSIVPSRISIRFGKCGILVGGELILNASATAVIDRELLDHMERLRNMFCLNETNYHTFDMYIVSDEQVNGTLIFSLEDNEKASILWVLVYICPALLIICFFVYLCKGTTTVYDVEKASRNDYERTAVMFVSAINDAVFFEDFPDHDKSISNISNASLSKPTSEENTPEHHF